MRHYNVDIRLCKRNPDGDWDYRNKIASVKHNFEVPQMEAGFSDEPLDLGQIRLELFGQSEVSNPKLAADFELPGLDGNKIKLSDFKGKVVLLVIYSGTQKMSPDLENKLAKITEIY